MNPIQTLPESRGRKGGRYKHEGYQYQRENSLSVWQRGADNRDDERE